jgi:FdhD protein
LELNFELGFLRVRPLALRDVLNRAAHANRPAFLVTDQDAAAVKDSESPVGTHPAKTRRREDLLAVEEPLEIRVGAQSVSVTMRTPGHDFELAAGFLFAEDIIRSASQIREITSTAPNIVNVELSSEVVIQPANSQRGFIMTSARGVCGRTSLESLADNRCTVVPSSNLTIDAGVIHRLPQQLRDRQEIFESTGGLRRVLRSSR